MIGVANMLIAAFGCLRIIRMVVADPPLFEAAPVRLDRGMRAAVGLACAGMVFMGLFLVPLSSAAAYGRAALFH